LSSTKKKRKINGKLFNYNNISYNNYERLDINDAIEYEVEPTAVTFTNAIADAGVTKRFNSLNVNGIKILKSASRFYVSEINEAILTEKMPTEDIVVGDEVIQINNLFCEHIRNVSKYIETNHISSIQLKKRGT